MAELPRCDGRGHIGAHSTIEFVKLAQHIAELPLLHATARRHAKVKSVLTKIIINKQTQYQNKKNIFYGKQPPLKRGKVKRHERTKRVIDAASLLSWQANSQYIHMHAHTHSITAYHSYNTCLTQAVGVDGYRILMRSGEFECATISVYKIESALGKNVRSEEHRCFIECGNMRV